VTSQHACWWDADHTLNSHSEKMGPVTTLICTTNILPWFGYLTAALSPRYPPSSPPMCSMGSSNL
jgi:hypothetical protein